MERQPELQLQGAAVQPVNVILTADSQLDANLLLQTSLGGSKPPTYPTPLAPAVARNVEENPQEWAAGTTIPSDPMHIIQYRNDDMLDH